MHPKSVDRVFDADKAKSLLEASSVKTYAGLARAMGLERQTVGHWFRGRGEPNVQQLKQMAKAMGCHWLELVDDDTTVVHQQAERKRVEQMRALDPEALKELDDYLAFKVATRGKK